MDYAKKKNDELAALCKERGLAHTGKKADFVKRLEDYDSAQTSAPSTTTATTAKPALEDEIDWDDEPAATEIAKTATTEPAADALAAGGVGPVKNPVDVPNQTVVEDPATTDDLTVASAPATAEPTTTDGEPTIDAEAKPEEEKVPEKDFSQGIAERTIDEEIEKRKARAVKFGLPEDSDDIKLLERAKRFGVTEGSKLPGMLNQALSSGGRKRGRAEGAAGEGGAGAEDGGVRKRNRGGRGGRGGRRQGSERPRRDEKPRDSGAPPAKKENGNGYASWMSDSDKAKADARKARFAAPS